MIRMKLWIHRAKDVVRRPCHKLAVEVGLEEATVGLMDLLHGIRVADIDMVWSDAYNGTFG